MENPLRPVVVFTGRNEFDSQVARDVLSTAMIPVIHLPSISTGIFGSPTTVRVAVPERYVDQALEALTEAGLAGEAHDPATGLAAFNEALQDRLPLHRTSLDRLPEGGSLRKVIVGLGLIILIVIAIGLLQK